MLGEVIFFFFNNIFFIHFNFRHKSQDPHMKEVVRLKILIQISLLIF